MLSERGSFKISFFICLYSDEQNLTSEQGVKLRLYVLKNLDVLSPDVTSLISPDIKKKPGHPTKLWYKFHMEQKLFVRPFWG